MNKKNEDRKRLVAGIVAAGIIAVFLARIVVPVDGIISFLRDMIIVLGITIFSKPLIKKNEEIKRQRRVVDDKEETFKTRLKNSFDAIDLPVPNQGDLRVILRNKKEEYFTNFYEEIEADQESEHKKNVKREVGIYAKEKINEMIEKNEDYEKKETTENIENEEDGKFCFSQYFLEPGLLRLKGEIRAKLERFPWLTGSYGITGPSRKIRSTHLFLTVKRRGFKKQDVIADLKKAFGDGSINYIELLRERKEPPQFTFLSDNMAMNRNGKDDQNQSFLAVEPCGGISSEEPSGGVSSEEPSGGISSEESSGGVSSEEPSGGISSEEPSGGISSEEPSGGVSSKEPSAGVSREEPSGGISSEEPCAGISSEEPSGGISSEEPSGGISSEEPSGGVSSEEPCAGISSEEPSDGKSSEEPSDGISSEEPCGGVSSEQPCAGISSKETSGGKSSKAPSDGISSEEPSDGISSEEPSGGISREEASDGISSEVLSGGISSKEPSGGISSEESSGGISREEPSGGISSEVPSGGISSEEPSGGISSEEPCGGVSSEQPCPGISSKEPSGGISREEPSGGISSEEPSEFIHHENSSSTAPTQEHLFKENSQSQAPGTLMLLTSDNSKSKSVFALTCYHVGCTDDCVRRMNVNKANITELHEYFTEDVNNEYSSVKRNDYFYHKRSEANTDDNDGDTTPNDTQKGDGDQSSSCNNAERNIVDEFCIKGNGGDDDDSTQDGESTDGNNNERSMDNINGQRFFLGKYCNGFFDAESDILCIDIKNKDVVVDSSKFDAEFSKDRKQMHAEFDKLLESKTDVTVEKIGYASNRTTGRLLCPSYCHRNEADGKILFENMYVVVVEKGKLPFFISADSGALVSWIDGENVKHGFAYAVCEVDKIDLPRLPAEYDSEAHEDESEQSSSSWSDNSEDGDGGIVFAENIPNGPENIPNGPYYLCHDIFTAFEKLQQKPFFEKRRK